MYIFVPGIFIAKKTAYLVLINVGGATLNAVLNLMFIPSLGFRGADLAPMIARGVVFSICMCYCQKSYSVPHHWLRLLVAALWVVVMVIIVNFFVLFGFWHWISVLITSAMAFAGFVFTGLIHGTEIKGLTILLKNKLQINSQ
jgi:peptidoglycan biosynthesis protein MviN/MurJ (putative lipid II flippase)